MNFRRLLSLAVVLGGVAGSGNAGMLYTFGGDFISLGATGAPTSLNGMDPASAASVTNVQTPVGDGNTGFNGGLVAVNSLLYGIGNDSNNFATLYSFQTTGLGLAGESSNFNTSGDATGFVFQNGLTAIGNNFYAIGAGLGGEALFQIGAGSATQLRFLNTFTGTFAGLAWDTAQSQFYAIIDGATSTDFNGDFLVKFTLGGPVQIVANLTSLDGAPVGTHLGGLYDAGGGILYDIYTNPSTFTGELEQINLNGLPSTATLYDSQIPLAQNAGIASVSTTPEPTAASMGIGGLAMLSLSWVLRRTVNGRTRF
jgi:hypothetical protein